MGILDVTVDKAGVIQLYPDFKFNILVRFSNTKNLLQQCHPETLCFLLLIAVACPVFYELFGCGFLLCIRHVYILPVHQGLLPVKS